MPKLHAASRRFVLRLLSNIRSPALHFSTSLPVHTTIPFIPMHLTITPAAHFNKSNNLNTKDSFLISDRYSQFSSSKTGRCLLANVRVFHFSLGPTDLITPPTKEGRKLKSEMPTL